MLLEDYTKIFATMLSLQEEILQEYGFNPYAFTEEVLMLQTPKAEAYRQALSTWCAAVNTHPKFTKEELYNESLY